MIRPIVTKDDHRAALNRVAVLASKDVRTDAESAELHALVVLAYDFEKPARDELAALLAEGDDDAERAGEEAGAQPDAARAPRARPIARSTRIPAALAPLAVEAIARASGADDAAARDVRNAVEAGRFRVVLAFHREDGAPLTDADLEALRAFASPAVSVAERAPKPAKKNGAKHRTTAKKPTA